MPYSNYTVEDFVADEYFIKWVKAPNEESNAFWNAWISQNPHHKALIQQARDILFLLEFKEKKAPEGKFLEVWENISRATEGKGKGMARSLTWAEDRKTVHRHSHKWFYKAAAAVIFFSLSLWGYSVYKNSSTITIATGYGESRTLFLPDSTKVTLNANSKLRYKQIDFTSNHREVWLDGQAFFAVTHKSNNENFKVHTLELQVEVLGTRFDVNSRRGKTKVILEEGKVKLDIDRQNEKRQTVVMKPGDLVEVAANSRKINRQVVDADDYLAWRNNRIEFTSSSLREIGQWIEDNYGYQVIFSDEELKERKFTGSSSNDDIQELLQKLSKVFGLDIKHEGNQIIIKEQ
jgi:transmembrane sensor